MNIRHSGDGNHPYSINCDHGELVAIATAVELACEQDVLPPEVLIPLQAALHREVRPVTANRTGAPSLPGVGDDLEGFAAVSPVVTGPGGDYLHAINCELLGGDPLNAIAEATI